MALPNEKPASAVYDKGRRGEPLPGCDCVQCFGYCMVNGDEAERARFANQDHNSRSAE
jgi:hypothetical protein